MTCQAPTATKAGPAKAPWERRKNSVAEPEAPEATPQKKEKGIEQVTPLKDASREAATPLPGSLGIRVPLDRDTQDSLEQDSQSHWDTLKVQVYICMVYDCLWDLGPFSPKPDTRCRGANNCMWMPSIYP